MYKSGHKNNYQEGKSLEPVVGIFIRIYHLKKNFLSYYPLKNKY